MAGDRVREPRAARETLPDDPDLGRIVGLRSVKTGHYAQLRGTTAQLGLVMTALERISRALVHTASGPEELLVAVVEMVRDHLSADWVVFALADGHLVSTAPRHLIADGRGSIMAFEGAAAATTPVGLPDEVLNRLNDILRGEFDVLAAPIIDDHHLHVPVELDGRAIGGLSAWTSSDRWVDPSDVVVMGIVASQASVALVNAELFFQAQKRATELAERNAELERTQRELSAAMRTSLLNTERSRIARELHDSVGQSVFSAGLQIELGRSEATGPAADHLDKAVRLTRDAMTQLRSAIYTLNDGANPAPSIAETLAELCSLHVPSRIESSVGVRGRTQELTGEVQHAVLRIAGESLFNAAVHSGADRVAVTLTYAGDVVRLWIDDDGTGDPGDLRRLLRTTARGDFDAGRRRGLANMASRADELGGELRIRRSRLGGIRIAVTIPVVRKDTR